MKTIGLLAVICLLLGSPQMVHAASDFVEDSTGNSSDSTFDPFSDYSEFEEGSEEEADLNFFHNGRFFTIGFQGGYQSFTDVLGSLYKPTFGYGLFLSYFFDLRVALQAGYHLSDHSLSLLDGATGREYRGKVALSRFEFDIKYYINTQNITRGLAALNPYLIGGFSSWTRTYTFDQVAGFVRDSAFGVQAGLGIEIPIMKNKAFIGAQGMYQYISFADKNAPIVINGAVSNIVPTGDGIAISGVIGVNF
ncbi:MAG: hypothetical protein IT289_10515 [Oligoflexia bacterium]|nr:hypothetical protein [Oligoflexia bacterium]